MPKQTTATLSIALQIPADLLKPGTKNPEAALDKHFKAAWGKTTAEVLTEAFRDADYSLSFLPGGTREPKTF